MRAQVGSGRHSRRRVCQQQLPARGIADTSISNLNSAHSVLCMQFPPESLAPNACVSSQPTLCRYTSVCVTRRLAEVALFARATWPSGNLAQRNLRTVSVTYLLSGFTRSSTRASSLTSLTICQPVHCGFCVSHTVIADILVATCWPEFDTRSDDLSRCSCVAT